MSRENITSLISLKDTMNAEVSIRLTGQSSSTEPPHAGLPRDSQYQTTINHRRSEGAILPTDIHCQAPELSKQEGRQESFPVDPFSPRSTKTWLAQLAEAAQLPTTVDRQRK